MGKITYIILYAQDGKKQMIISIFSPNISCQYQENDGIVKFRKQRNKRKRNECIKYTKKQTKMKIIVKITHKNGKIKDINCKKNSLLKETML